MKSLTLRVAGFILAYLGVVFLVSLLAMVGIAAICEWGGASADTSSLVRVSAALAVSIAVIHHLKRNKNPNHDELETQVG